MLLCVVVSGVVFLHYAVIWARALYRCSFIIREKCRRLALILAAPAIGHIFPLFHKGRGGKGIATTFGSLLGLFPVMTPVLVLAVCFIFFSLILRITPHFYRTIGSYGVSFIMLCLMQEAFSVKLGFLLITIAVGIRFVLSKEEKDKIRVSLLWKR